MFRMVSVTRCSGPRTLSTTGSSDAYWSLAPRASPASPGPAGEVGTGGLGC